MIKLNLHSKDSNIVCKAIITDNKGRVLLLLRPPDVKKFPNSWDLPGGHIHVGEPKIHGLRREVKEETGLDLVGVKYAKTVKNRHFYLCKSHNFNIKLSDEHSDYLFKEVEDLDTENKFENIAKEILRNEQRNT